MKLIYYSVWLISPDPSAINTVVSVSYDTERPRATSDGVVRDRAVMYVSSDWSSNCVDILNLIACMLVWIRGICVCFSVVTELHYLCLVVWEHVSLNWFHAIIFPMITVPLCIQTFSLCLIDLKAPIVYPNHVCMNFLFELAIRFNNHCDRGSRC